MSGGPPRIKLQTFALSPGQYVVAKCAFCGFTLQTDIAKGGHMAVKPCEQIKCRRAVEAIP